MSEVKIEVCSFCRESQSVPRLNTLKGTTETSSSDSHQLILNGVKLTGKEIGRGAYGRVFEVEYEITHCAAKEMHALLLECAQNDKTALQKIKDSFFNECHIWSQLKHPCIVQFIGVYYPVKDNLPVIVMEKMYNSLRGLVEKHTDIPCTSVASILHDVCCGLQYLHSRNPPIVHRDLTPNNILLCYHLRAKITDLGVAKVIKTTDTKTLTKAPGTYDFMPPESLANNPVYGLPLDIFSFGGVILYVTVQQWPQPAPWIDFDPETHSRIILTEIQRRQQYLNKMTGAYTYLKPLVISCLDDNPMKRPLAAQVLLDVKKAKNAYHEKFYSTIWESEVSSERQVHNQGHIPQKQQLQAQIQKGDEEKQQHEQKVCSNLKEKELPQTVSSGVGGQISKVRKSIRNLFSKKSKKPAALKVQNVSQVGANYPLFIGEHDYSSIDDNELNFKKGDMLYIIDDSEGDWWFARDKHSGKEGYIPCNYVKDSKIWDTEDWFFGDIKRSEANKLLLQQGNPNGAFLIRSTSDKKTQKVVLSLRNNYTVKHYKIQCLDNGNYYIKSTLTFQTIQELIAHYKQDASGLAQRLSKSCNHLNQSNTMSLGYKDEWEIGQKMLQFDKKLGMGNFGEVWSGLLNNTTPVAIKVLKSGTIEISDFVAEVQAVMKFDHPNLLQLYGVCTLEEPILIVTELTKYGSLLTYLRKGEGRSLKLPQLIDMAVQIAGGMAYLEECSYDHRNLAARNILLSDGNLCKVADFGLVRYIKGDPCNPGKDVKFPIKWTAPEAALYNRFSIKSDVWSFGIVIYEMLTKGAMPYPGMNNRQVLEAIEQNYRIPSPDSCPDALYKIMLSCWENDIDDRPTFEHLKYQLENYFVLEAEAVYELNHLELQFDKKLGIGNFGEVWSGLLNNTTPVAIKELKPETIDISGFVAEVQVMMKFDHPNLLQLYGVCTLEEPILIVTELMKHGSLLDYLRKGEGKDLKLPQLINMATQIAGGMAYLEECPYDHRNLAARNILVGDDNLCKIADLGLARNIEENPYDSMGVKLPIKWTAPEAALYNRFSIKSDVWSFGIVIYELLTKGAVPYPGMSNRQVLEAIEQDYRIPSPNNCPDALYKIMLSCWKCEADDRPTFENLKYQLKNFFALEAKADYQLDREVLQFNKKLGMGNFGEVWSGLLNNTTPVAIKVLKSKIIEVSGFLIDVQVLMKFCHPNLLQFHGVCTLEEPVHIVTELMKHGSLLNYLHKGEGKNLKLPQLVDMAAQIAGGMAYLEECSYDHRNLAARNILVGDGNLCKVADLGLARNIKEDPYDGMGVVRLPIKWTAPEAALYNRFSIKSDVWSFGIVIYEVLTKGAVPYPGMSNSQVLEAIKQDYRMPSPDNCPDALYNIMFSCWKYEADNRPTFEHLKYQLEKYFASEAEAMYELDQKMLQFDKNIIMGVFGKVWSGLLNNTTPVAIEELKPETIEVSGFVAEVQVMMKFDHPYLLKLYGVCTLEEPILIVTELMKHGSLLDYLRKGEGRNLKLIQLINMATQIAGGMAYLEECSYDHRNLAARSILVGDNNLCKVANLGLARCIKEDPYKLVSVKLPIKWTAPEAALYNRFSIKSDVWSFGIVIYELLTKGAVPYPGMDDHQVLEAVKQDYRMPPPNNCPDALYNIMLSCWKCETDIRPTFEHLKYQLQNCMSVK